MKYKIKRMTRRSRIVGLLLMIMIGMAVWISSQPEHGQTSFNQGEISTLPGSVYVSCRGVTTKSVLPVTIEASAGDTIVITRKLGEDAISGNAIMFYVKQAETKVYLDEELIWQDPEWATPFPMLEGSYWRLIRMPASYEGKTLRIEMIPVLDKYAGELPVIYTGAKSDLIYMVIRQGLIFLILGVVAFILGVLILAAGIVMRKDGIIATRMCYLGLFSILTGIWGTLEARITQLFTGNIPRASFLVFSCFAMIPVLIMAFVMTYESLRGKWYMKALFYLTVANFVLQQLLQITGIVYYMQMVTVVHVLFVLIMIGLAAGYIEMKRDPKAKNDSFIYQALLVLAVFGMGDIVWYCVFPERRVGTFLRIGILFFIAYLGYDTIRQIGNLRIQEVKHSFYKELAFTDIMTGLNNRTSFENTMKDIRKQQERQKHHDEKASWIMMMVDMNELKTINDEYGHDRGDEAIFRLASNLKKYFGMLGDCFRIGGDEFCVLAPDIGMERFEEACERFKKEMEIDNAELPYPFSASIGYVMLDESGADECLKKADAKMYEEKRRRKHVRR